MTIFTNPSSWIYVYLKNSDIASYLNGPNGSNNSFNTSSSFNFYSNFINIGNNIFLSYTTSNNEFNAGTNANVLHYTNFNINNENIYLSLFKYLYAGIFSYSLNSFKSGFNDNIKFGSIHNKLHNKKEYLRIILTKRIDFFSSSVNWLIYNYLVRSQKK